MFAALFTSLEIWRVVFSSEVGCQYKSNTHPSAEAWFYCYDFVSCTGRKTGFKSFPKASHYMPLPPHSLSTSTALAARHSATCRSSKQKQQTFHDLKMIFFSLVSFDYNDCDPVLVVRLFFRRQLVC